eukprot:TRINITY_DN1210_c0_g1_i1.p1 TRINITY_DN1210_c0_g1~~TRINITY_DN1210_c0_g1_i1.p1  ORF type:complete len:140 (+),score=20.53 TRINITY_DN1210_c0_g1_i1:113-532(+)
MVVFSLYIYDREGTCLYYAEWKRTLRTNTPEEDQKLMYGLYFSLRAFTKEIAPKDTYGFQTYTTNVYRAHVFESGTGFKFILTTDPSVENLRDQLHEFYSTVFLERVLRQPNYKPGTLLHTNEFFVKMTDDFIRMLSGF